VNPTSTPQDTWGFGGIVTAGGMLVFDPLGNGGLGTFGYQAGHGLGKLTVAVLAPGVRCWRVELIGATQPQLGVCQFVSSDPAFADFDARVIADVTGSYPGIAVFFIVDSTGAPVDPSTVSAVDPAGFFAIQFFSILSPGNQSQSPGPP